MMMKTIELSQGKFAFVDDEDYEMLMAMGKWSASKSPHSFYACKYVDGKYTGMHRIIMSPPDRCEVDHINGNGLDNRRSNLRICTHSENSRNRGRNKNNKIGMKRVRFLRGKYEANICFKGKQIYLGCFNSSEEAYAAYCKKGRELFGDFFHG